MAKAGFAAEGSGIASGLAIRAGASRCWMSRLWSFVQSSGMTSPTVKNAPRGSLASVGERMSSGQAPLALLHARPLSKSDAVSVFESQPLVPYEPQVLVAEESEALPWL